MPSWSITDSQDYWPGSAVKPPFLPRTDYNYHTDPSGYGKILLVYSLQTYAAADIFDTFVYRRGIGNMDYSFVAAVGLFQMGLFQSLVCTVFG